MTVSTMMNLVVAAEFFPLSRAVKRFSLQPENCMQFNDDHLLAETDNMKVSKSDNKMVKQHRNTAQINIEK